MSELSEFPKMKYVIMCDKCQRVLDYLCTGSPDWAKMYEDGELYAGEVKCWRCAEKEKAEHGD